ncbi:ABC transporter substrate-binding protein [Zophobihabitans entericus]|uniref:ABC transporter substrate-binding protein n=1 Tax=Zophobihabitans entericus TaxID=1635327 RepID=A0A6G9IBT2_9GAMM|nr:ABC transporter substrate-binding protein [Zophobihabitans entericus]QIQ21174.1 ABC transporter substrate-binding protein [Zophobihabitans entericus]
MKSNKALTKTFAAVALSIGCLFSSMAMAKTVVDIVGREVEVPEQVNRILLGEGRIIHSLALLEGDKPFARIAGWQGDFRKLDTQNYEVYREKFPEIDKIPLIGNTTEDSISAEKVLTLNPDIAVFGLSGHGPGRDSQLVKLLESSGVPVIFVDFRSYPMKNTIPSMRLLGDALNREAEATRYINFYEENLKRVTDVVNPIPEDQRTTVFIELKAATSEDCCSTAGNGNMGEFIDAAGGLNISKSLLPATLGHVNLEKIIAVDPQVYIVSGTQAPDSKNIGAKLGALVTEDQSRATAAAVFDRNGIRDLTAVKTKNTHAIWHGYYNSAYNILAIQAFAKWFYPEKFADLDPKQTMNELYSEFLAVEPRGTFWVDNYTAE